MSQVTAQILIGNDIISGTSNIYIGSYNINSRWYTYSVYKNRILSSTERETLYNLGYENPGVTSSIITITINPNTYTMLEIASLFSTQLGINVTYSDTPENKLVFDITNDITLTGLSLEIFTVTSKKLTSSDNELLFVVIPEPEPETYMTLSDDNAITILGESAVDGLSSAFNFTEANSVSEITDLFGNSTVSETSASGSIDGSTSITYNGTNTNANSRWYFVI